MTIKIGHRNPFTGVITTECPETINVIQNDCCGCAPSETPAGEFKTFRYGCTPLDTTGDNILTITDYLASLENEATTEEIGTFLDGGNIQALFKNTADSVCYIEVPDDEPAFTRFSIIGNSFMQNLPIKQELDGEYSEIFKIDNFYFTMVQTHFSGPVLLMR